MSDLAGQVAVITGASSGIGEAVAKDLRQAGLNLVISARREDRLKELAGQIGQTTVVAGDILDPDLPAKLIDTAVQTYGRCDVVFNNAGTLVISPLDEIDIDKVCHMVRINVEAAFRMAHAALMHFRKTSSADNPGGDNAGHLINTSSIMGTKVRPTAGWYAGTKYALEALCEALRMELAGTDIRISCIEPGLVVTELHNDWPTPPAQVLNIPNPLVPEDIARLVRFILEQPKHVRLPRIMILPGEHSI